MKTFELTESEIISIMNKVLNAPDAEEKERRRRARIRAAKADFCNLNVTDYCKFIPTK